MIDKDLAASSNFPDVWIKIPLDIKQLLFYINETPPDTINKWEMKASISSEEGVKIQSTFTLPKRHDPSTIYFPLPITMPHKESDVPPPERYATYRHLTPEQKYIYLNWLNNINRPINEGYRFLFLFGLERQLLIGNFNAAWEMIIRLKNSTLSEINESRYFRYKSTNTLFTTCIMLNRIDLLQDITYIYEEPAYNDVLIWDDMQILVKYYNHEPIDAKEAINLLKRTSTRNRRYIENAPKYYAEEMAKLLLEKTGHSFIRPSDYIFEENRKKPNISIGFINPSFPFELRNPEILLPDTNKLTTFLHELHPECHERTKLQLRKNMAAEKEWSAQL